MTPTAMFIIIACFVALLFLNIYFRVKVFKYYKILVQNRVQFSSLAIFDTSKIDQIKLRYPDHSEAIEGYMGSIRSSVRIAIFLIALITIMACILHQWQ